MPGKPGMSQDDALFAGLKEFLRNAQDFAFGSGYAGLCASLAVNWG